MNEMAAGCCVCSDETGWAENPLVYCDGVGCNIAVHKACYGIVTVPSGNWYCRKCESQERSARVRCELCPSKDGALKRTDSGSWAHVICGLYIPEVRFLSVQTMEPIVLSQIPTDRYNKVCYICEQDNRGSKATIGACMDCNKSGCKLQFHVTCAQRRGLLCEEPGNYLDNVKYCGYCQEHYTKLKKGLNVKTIPAFRPNLGIDESSDRNMANVHQHSVDLKQNNKRKSLTNRSNHNNGSLRVSMADRKEIVIHRLNISQSNSSQNMDPLPQTQQASTKDRIPLTTMTSVDTTPESSSKNDNSSRFTTSNFVESVITPSESIFADMQKNKKRKVTEMTESSLDENISVSILPKAQSPKIASIILAELERNSDDEGIKVEDDDESATLKFVEEPNLSFIKTEPGKTSNPTVASSESSITSSVISTVSSVLTSSAKNSSSNFSVNQKATSVGQTASPTTNVNISQRNVSTSSSYLTSSPTISSETKGSEFQNNTSSAPQMLGNQLNPTSSMAQKMFDSLNDELEARNIFTNTDSQSNTNNFVGPPLYNKIISSTRIKEAAKHSESSSNGGGPLASLSSSAANFPQSLEELLEKQWEQGGTFLMEQAQHFDIASLLTCLHKLRQENLELEEHVRKLKARRDHLLGVNARLAMPLAPISQPVNSNPMHTEGPHHVASPQQIPLSIHHQGSHIAQTPHQQVTVSSQSAGHQPNVLHQTGSQSYQSNVNTSSANLNDANHLRNISVSGVMYTSATNSTIRGSPHDRNMYHHAMENGMPSLHQQHSRTLPSLPASVNARHHNSSNTSKYVNQQQSNPGVLVRAPSLTPEIPRADRRSTSVLSSNY